MIAAALEFLIVWIIASFCLGAVIAAIGWRANR